MHGIIAAEAIFSDVDLSEVDLSGANPREAGLVGTNLLDSRFDNLISIEDADFSGTQKLSEHSREYLLSIATGAHPVTGINTTKSLE